MLRVIGTEKIADLFQSIPEKIRLDSLLNMDPPKNEYDLLKELKTLSRQSNPECLSFLGAGCYRHFVPSVIAPLVSRGEFLTAYTPYQPEISQGTLQVMFEFQTLMSRLTGMDISNSSMYEGASALAEAILMAKRIRPKATKVLLSAGLHPEYEATVRTYLTHLDLAIKTIPLMDSGQTDFSVLEKELDESVICSVLQVVNFCGVIEDQEAHSQLLSNSKALNIAVLPEMTALGLLAPPGKFGADIVVGEGQSLGLPTSYGGPNIGVLATKNAYMRQIPGRISGQTVDKKGARAFCLTLATREQHIRREKATSNICSNQMLCALWVTIYLSLLGKNGLKELARLNYAKTDYARKQIATVSGYRIRYSALVYNEFVLELPIKSDLFLERMRAKNILAGVALSRFDSNDDQAVLLNFTELNSKEEIDMLIEHLGEVTA